MPQKYDGNILGKYLSVMIGILFHPAKTLEDIQEETGRTILGYGVLILGINILLTVFAGMTGLAQGVQVPAVVASLLLIPVGGLWLHLWVYGFGGREGMASTFRLLLVGLTPTALLGWIPGVALLGFLWSLVILFLGVQEVHHLSTSRAVMVLLLTLGIPLLILGVLSMVPGIMVFWPEFRQITWV